MNPRGREPRSGGRDRKAPGNGNKPKSENTSSPLKGNNSKPEDSSEPSKEARKKAPRKSDKDEARSETTSLASESSKKKDMSRPVKEAPRIAEKTGGVKSRNSNTQSGRPSSLQEIKTKTRGSLRIQDKGGKINEPSTDAIAEKMDRAHSTFYRPPSSLPSGGYQGHHKSGRSSGGSSSRGSTLNHKAPPFQATGLDVYARGSLSSSRMDVKYPELTEAEVAYSLSKLQITEDKLREHTSASDYRQVYSCVRPIVCHKTNTPFYAQCSTAKLGYCTWCKELRRGTQKQGSICMNCGERLTAKYHRWYQELVRLEPLEKDRKKETYKKHKPLLEQFGITWKNEKQLQFVVDHYMLMKIFLSSKDFAVEPLHLERTYMVGVFAGREFNTGALARKLLREGCGLSMFRADFPDFFEFMREERATVAENLNRAFFMGDKRCYFHAHHTNIEGWYDPQYLSREQIVESFKALCNSVLQEAAKSQIASNHGSSGRRSHRRRNKSSSNSRNNPLLQNMRSGAGLPMGNQLIGMHVQSLGGGMAPPYGSINNPSSQQLQQLAYLKRQQDMQTHKMHVDHFRQVRTLTSTFPPELQGGGGGFGNSQGGNGGGGRNNSNNSGGRNRRGGHHPPNPFSGYARGAPPVNSGVVFTGLNGFAGANANAMLATPRTGHPSQGPGNMVPNLHLFGLSNASAGDAGSNSGGPSLQNSVTNVSVLSAPAMSAMKAAQMGGTNQLLRHNAPSSIPTLPMNSVPMAPQAATRAMGPPSAATLNALAYGRPGVPGLVGLNSGHSTGNIFGGKHPRSFLLFLSRWNAVFARKQPRKVAWPWNHPPSLLDSLLICSNFPEAP